MPSIEVRPFRRSDREQLTDLVNTHAAAVVPGLGVSVSAVLSDLERQPGEAIVDPWVSERLTLVAEQRDRVAAAAHLLRYGTDERVGPGYRGAGEIHWLLFWPEAPAGNPYWTDATEAAEELIAACLRQLEDWGVTSQSAEGELPVPGVYGVPEQWPHVRALYQRAGFAHTGHTEVVYLARVEDLACAGPARGRAGRPAVGGHERDPAVGRAGRGSSRLHRGGDLRVPVNGCPAAAGGPTSATSGSPGSTAAAASPRGCSGRRATGCGWPRSAGSSITRGWTARTPPARTTPRPGRSWPRRRSPS